jgi:hypothetical protein
MSGIKPPEYFLETKLLPSLKKAFPNRDLPFVSSWTATVTPAAHSSHKNGHPRYHNASFGFKEPVKFRSCKEVIVFYQEGCKNPNPEKVCQLPVVDPHVSGYWT